MLTGKLERVDGLLTGGYLISIYSDYDPHLSGIVGEDIVFGVKKYRKRRSLDANSYYWILVTKLAEAIRESKSRVHNKMLRQYGQRFLVDGKPVLAVLLDTEETEKQTLEDDAIHLKQTSEVKSGKDGKLYRTYVLMRGSHDYDSREMSILIDGIISECQEVGIETMTPDELERLRGYEKQAFKTV